MGCVAAGIKCDLYTTNMENLHVFLRLGLPPTKLASLPTDSTNQPTHPPTHPHTHTHTHTHTDAHTHTHTPHTVPSTHHTAKQ